MKLIRELNEEVQVLTEETKDGKKCTYIKGVFLQSDVQNRNHRVYPYNVLVKEVNRYNKEMVESKRAFGELGHPDGPGINLDRVSHRITEITSDGKNFIGKAIITEGTPNGAIVKGLLDAGARLGVSSRGVGSVKENEGVTYVQEDYRIATAADIVADPSAPDAFVDSLMESEDWILHNDTWVRAGNLKSAKKQISETKNRRRREEKALKLFEGFLRNL